MELSQEQTLKLFYELSKTPYHINPVYVRLLNGDANGAFLLTQLILWQVDYGVGFYHTDETITEKTGLNRGVIGRARKEFVSLGFVQTELKGVPAQLHYTVNIEAIIKAIVSRGGCGLPTCTESIQQDVSNQYNKLYRNDTSITKENRSTNKINNKSSNIGGESTEGLEFQIDPPLQGPVCDVVEEMVKIGIDQTRATHLVQNRMITEIKDAIDITNARAKSNPPAYFEQALAKRWRLPRITDKKGAPKDGRIGQIFLQQGDQVVAEAKARESIKSSPSAIQGNLAFREMMGKMRLMNKAQQHTGVS